MGRLDEAAHALERSVTLNPENVPALFNLGNCYVRLGRGEEARKALDRFTRASGSQEKYLDQKRLFRAAQARADSLAHEGKDDKSLEALLAYRDSLTDFSLFQQELGVAYLRLGRRDDAIAAFERAVAKDPTLTDGDGALKEGGAIDAAGRPQLLLGGKGIFYMELRARSMARDAHSGGATHLPNAAWHLVRALASLIDERGHVLVDGFYDDVRKPTPEEIAHVRSLPFEAAVIKKIYAIDRFAWGRADDEVRHASVFEPTCNIAGIEAGFTGDGSKTVIPSEAMVKIDFRLVPDQDPKRVRELVRAYLDSHGFRDIELVAREGTMPYRGRMDDPLVRAAQSVAEEAFGQKALLIPTSGGTSPMFQVCGKRKLANVTLGMGHPNSGAHAPNEHILLDNYWKALRATVALYGRYATQE